MKPDDITDDLEMYRLILENDKITKEELRHVFSVLNREDVQKHLGDALLLRIAYGFHERRWTANDWDSDL